jgi:hypothetical protein
LEEAAHSLDGVVKIGKIDAKLIPNLKIEKNPTYMFTRSDSPQKSAPFEGTLNSKDIAKFCLEQLSGFVKSRLSFSFKTNFHQYSSPTMICDNQKLIQKSLYI